MPVDRHIDASRCKAWVLQPFEDQPGESGLARSINCNEWIELALGRVDLRQIDMEISDRVSLEALLRRLVAIHLRQTVDPVPLEAAMQGRSRQVWDRRLQPMETVIERQQRMAAESDDDRLLFLAENGRSWRFRPDPEILDPIALPPLGDHLRVDPIPPGKNLQALLTILYCPTDCRSRYGPVAVWCRSKCWFKPPSVRKRPGFSSPVLSGGGADCRSY